MAQYLTSSGGIMNDGIQNGQKYLFDDKQLPNIVGPPSLSDVQKASIRIPNLEEGGEWFESSHNNIAPWKSFENIGAYMVNSEGNVTFKDGGRSINEVTADGRFRSSGDKALSSALDALLTDGCSGYIVSAHTHPDKNAGIYDGLGIFHIFGPQSQPPSKDDIDGVRLLRQRCKINIHSGIIITKDNLYRQDGTQNSVTKYSWDSFDKFLKSK